MRKLFLCVLFLTIINSVSLSQTMRLVKGLKFLDCQAGILSDGYMVEGSFNYMIKNKIFYHAGGNYSFGQINSTVFEIIGLSNTLNINLISIRKNLYINIGAGLNTGYEFLNSEKEDRIKEKFTIGPCIDIEAEIVVIGDFSLVFKAQYINRLRSTFYKNYDSFSAGMRYYF